MIATSSAIDSFRLFACNRPISSFRGPVQTLGHLRRSRTLRPRNPADYRTVLWVALAISVAALQYAWPQTVFFALPFSLYLGIACGVIAHNHNHRPTFDDR